MKKKKAADPATLAAVLDRVREDAVPSEAIPDRLAKAQANLAKARTAERQLFGVEAKAKPKLTAEVQKLVREEARLAGLTTRPYPHVSLEPLTWRNAKGFPRFALFSIENPRFTIDSEEGAKLMLPDPIAACFTDVKEKLQLKGLRPIVIAILVVFGIFLGGCIIGACTVSAWWLIMIIPAFVISVVSGGSYGRSRVSISAEYEGVIPDATREKISKAKWDFRELFLLAEVPQWKLNVVRAPLSDPLVLGYRDGNLWLVDAFDTTPTEEYVRQEFAS